MNQEYKKNIFPSLELLYEKISQNNIESTKPKSILELRDWINSVCEFDNRDGAALPTSINKINSEKYFNNNNNINLKDRLWKIINHSSKSILYILKELRTKVIREHKIMPIHSVRHVDSKTIQWLSKKTGRTIQEKLAGKPYIKAMNRKMSTNTTENRLFKDYLTKLMRYIESNLETFPSNSHNLYNQLQRSIKDWLNSVESAEISSWSNLPPNNTLLQDRNYRKIWDSWVWLQKLDDDIKGDQIRFSKDWSTILFWTILSKLNQFEEFRLTEQPVSINGDKFDINPCTDIYGVLYSLKNNKPTIGFNFNLNKNHIILSLGDKYIDIRLNYLDDIVSIQIKNNKKEYDFSINSINSISEQFEYEFIDTLIENGYDLNLIENKNIIGEHQNSDIVLDIVSLQPSYSINGNNKKLPFKQLYQIWKDNGQMINLGKSRAIGLHNKATTISIFDILSPSDNISKTDLHDIMMKFSKNISVFFKDSKTFTYLVPDLINDFRLATMRSNINFYFNNSNPLPRSIATLFSWIDKNNKKINIQPDDCVLVIDKITNLLTFTPLIAKKSTDKKLMKLIPKTQGFHWERHPTFNLEFQNQNANYTNIYKQDGCIKHEELIQLIGTDCIEQFSDDVTFIFDKDNHYTVSKEINKKRQFDKKLPMNYIKSHISKIAKNNIYVIFDDSVNSNIKITPNPKNVIISQIEESKCIGASTLNQWQNLVKNIPLWTDHLPKLAIDVVKNNSPYKFYLVDDAAIIPKRGYEIDIPISETFELPKNRAYYTFPLTQGEDGNQLDFKVYLISSDFPLSETTKYRVKLTYKYGEDDPYQLFFVPNDESSSLKTIKAEWRDADEFILEELIYPDFPEKRDWKEFKKFKDTSNQTRDFFKLLLTKLDTLKHVLNIKKDLNRVNDFVDWSAPEKGYLFSDDDIFCHQSRFINLSIDNFSKIFEGMEISYVLGKGDNGKIRGEHILIEEDEEGNNINNIIIKNRPAYNQLVSEVRFYMFTLWKNSSITDYLEENRPNDFVKNFSKTILDFEQYIISSDYDKKIRDELLFLLSITNKDITKNVAKVLTDLSKNKKTLISYNKYIAYALGDLSVKWQQEIFNKLLKNIDKKRTINIFSIIFWRSENTIHCLNKEQIELALLNVLHSLKNREKNGINNKQEAGFFVIDIEILLALLRTRSSNDPDIKVILLPNKKIVKDLLNVIVNLTTFIVKKRIQLKSRLEITLDKPDIYKDTPDLLYALKAYLECDTGANSITITGVSDD